MKHKPLVKYQIGIVVLVLFVIILLVLVVSQASATKQDTNTYNQATTIANSLNNFIDSNSAIPEDLASAGINNVPSSISYHKLSNSSYQFCVNYKTTSSDFDASDVETGLVTSTTSNSPNESVGPDDTDLYIDTTHHKGENCQTIQPYVNNVFGGQLYNSN